MMGTAKTVAFNIHGGGMWTMGSVELLVQVPQDWASTVGHANAMKSAARWGGLIVD